MSDGRLRVGLVGCGHNGLAHADCWRRHDDAELVAVCDLLASRREGAAHRFGVPGYERVEDLLAAESLDVVCVNTPDPFHVEPFVAALEAGCHVFVEKPMADTIAGLERMVAAAAARPAQRVLVGQVLRFNPFFGRVKELCDAGTLGRLFYLEADYLHNLFIQAEAARYNAALGMNWYTEREAPAIGGGVHPLDLLRWFAGEPVTEVTGYANKLAFPAMQQPDCQVFLARFAGGAIAKVTSAYGPVGPRPPANHLSLYGTRGTIREYGLWLGEGHEAEYQDLSELDIAGHPYDGEVADLVSAIREGTPTRCGAADGANSAAVVIRAVESAALGRPLPVPTY